MSRPELKAAAIVVAMQSALALCDAIVGFAGGHTAWALFCALACPSMAYIAVVTWRAS